eukprot:scaffold4823_cov98-Isochrysis_galbana.AAC.3
MAGGRRREEERRARHQLAPLAAGEAAERAERHEARRGLGVGRPADSEAGGRWAGPASRRGPGKRSRLRAAARAGGIIEQEPQLHAERCSGPAQRCVCSQPQMPVRRQLDAYHGGAARHLAAARTCGAKAQIGMRPSRGKLAPLHVQTLLVHHRVHPVRHTAAAEVESQRGASASWSCTRPRIDSCTHVLTCRPDEVACKPSTPSS